jgi:hypothetical protein
MTEVVPDETVPSEVSLYLLPTERRVITVRRHPVVFLPGTLALTGSMTALALTSAEIIPRHDATFALFGALLPFSCLLFYHQVRAYLRAYVVFTNARVMLINLKWRHPLIVIPITDAFTMTFVRLTPFRPFSLYAPYGSFIIDGNNQRKRPQKIKYLPYSEQIYIEVSGLLLPDPDASS